MMHWSLAHIARAVSGRLVAGGGNIMLEGVATDTRQACARRLFIALQGERFDAHDYLEEAVDQGAAALLVHSADKLPRGVPVILAEDTRLALGRLAAAWRRKYPQPVIAVTGSNGKTTTREMIAGILKTAWGENSVLTPQGNFNNDIGVPLTLLRLGAEHKAAVLEMGMNHPGEIGYLTRIVRPTAALITNAQRAHLEGMGNLTSVAMEKASIYDGLEQGGVALINNDDPQAALWQRKNASRPTLTFALEHPADVRGEVSLRGLGARLVLATAQGSRDFELRIPGRHNAMNACAAAAAGLAVGLELDALVEGLRRFSGVNGRLQQKTGPYGALILDDTYNANPDSVRAGIDVLAGMIGRQFLVLGDMGEVGESSAQHHDEIGGYARSMGVDRLYALGEASAQAARGFGEGARVFRTPEALVKALLEELKDCAKNGGGSGALTLLVKGSRFMRMERVVGLLLNAAQAEEGAN
ncbi:MAG: UDP-N-acetylmuramoyl-tripeptide--D-alanyl-D-alanine ligase [Zoogloeaceae bacterium]|jgi:UDP-N-acetylmuramoyl-tripeptide--D-alanyl-D-alanine ligase|nr:UDP-N-acetylmuramoyl-tripeptide--D-alanyl-D-alanine ligase [Zoogloeaceae bacterium]